ncbi:MAG: hypothetical protein HQL93_12460, partial [Magnetococcales bacterium]|nr:hypothetical protein [Magnetococcales bacterium]
MKKLIPWILALELGAASMGIATATDKAPDECPPNAAPGSCKPDEEQQRKKRQEEQQRAQQQQEEQQRAQQEQIRRQQEQARRQQEEQQRIQQQQQALLAESGKHKPLLTVWMGGEHIRH